MEKSVVQASPESPHQDPHEKRLDSPEIPVYNELERVAEADLSLGAILRGAAAKPLTTFEKKAALINVELDKFGLGRYQICIWFLCGFGYFLDLAWAQGVGIIATAIYQEMGVVDPNTRDIFSLGNAGLAVGAFGFGILVDIIGRRWAFNLTCLITSVFGLILAAPKYNYGAIGGIYFLASLGLGGNIPIDAAIALEFLPQNRRYLVFLLSLWQPIGVVFASAVALGTAAKYRCPPPTSPAGTPLAEVQPPAARYCHVVPAGQPCCTVSSNMGWRYTLIILGCVTLTIFFLRYVVFSFYESPKFLLSKGQDAKAIEVLHKIAKFNKAPPPTLTLEVLQALDEVDSQDSREVQPGPQSSAQHAKSVLVNVLKSFKHLKGLFASKLQSFTFVLLAIAYMGDYWSFNLAGSYLPIILFRNNVDSGQNTVQDTYIQYLIIYSPGVIGSVFALLSVQLPLVGRKWSLVFSAVCQGVSMALYTQVKTTAGYVGLNALEYIMQTYFNAVLYASAPELFDTTYRGSASGMLSCLGRLSGIVAPIAGAEYLGAKSPGVLWLGAGGIWLSAFVMVFLPVEMRDRQMF